jgi:DNA-binding transcriptional LysR family regulator|tara:strand:+ start:333 stop:1223 length:891 start_codon:yes stop_codon:yes gene_type:complete
MELQQIRYFIAVYETLNFTKAAAQCQVSQPALTKAIKRLEDYLGSTLFVRDGRRVIVSEFGKILHPNLEEMLRQDQAVKTLSKNFRLLDKTPLSVGVMVTIGPTALAPFLVDFRTKHPGIEVSVVERPLMELLRALKEGEVEVALLHDPEQDNGDIRAEPIYQERYVVVLPPGHALAARDEIRLKDLSKQSYVDRLSCEMRELVMAKAAMEGVELYARFRSEHEDWVQGMVLAGMGFAFMPEYAVTAKDLIVRPLVDPAVSRMVSIASMRGRKWSLAASAFSQSLRTYTWPRKLEH